jgi:hypothetical protein
MFLECFCNIRHIIRLRIISSIYAFIGAGHTMEVKTPRLQVTQVFRWTLPHMILKVDNAVFVRWTIRHWWGVMRSTERCYRRRVPTVGPDTGPADPPAGLSL